MLEARKENKVYKINEQQKKRYLEEGFDVYEDGNLVEVTPKKLMKYADHLVKIAEITKSKDAEIARLHEQLDTSLSTTNVEALLVDYAKLKGVDVGSASSPTGILNKILEAEKE